MCGIVGGRGERRDGGSGERRREMEREKSRAAVGRGNAYYNIGLILSLLIWRGQERKTERTQTYKYRRNGGTYYKK
jgi:hypothetical protein